MIGLLDRLLPRGVDRTLLMKAIRFGLVGVVNVAVNYLVFWLMLRAIEPRTGLGEMLREVAAATDFVTAEDAAAIFANVVAWIVAVTGSYVMNSFYTFAAESGRRLTWRAYLTFAASGVLGLIADTTALLIASRFLPIMLAKLVAIGAGFVVNFSMSHFVVFRPRQPDRHP
ncbi:MAG TPA: GtrA family protein [Pseudolabrys sp.]|nr:GtrA family protein [Pseudolabrys sp.]